MSGRKTGLLARFWAMLRETFGDAQRAETAPVLTSQAVIAAAARQILAAGPRPVSALPPIAAPAVVAPAKPIEPVLTAPMAVANRNLAGRIRVTARLNIPAHRSQAAMARTHGRLAAKKAAVKKVVTRHVWLETRKTPVVAAKPQLRLVADNTRRIEMRVPRAA